MSTASHMQQVNVTGVNSLPPNKQPPTQNHKPTHNGTTSSPPNIGTQNQQQTTTVQQPATNGVVTNGATGGGGGGEPNGGTPPVNNAPKYGTLVPNRVFVGGISANTTEVELAQLFSAYGTVKATKIISDRAGVSKGYGFVTFESEEEAKRLQRESDNIMLRERRLNIAPAIKKQPFNRGFDVSSPPPQSAAAAAAAAAGQTQFYYAAAAAAAAGQVPYAAYQNGMAYYTPAPPPPPQSAGGAAAAAAAAASADLGAAQPLYQAPPVYATPTAAPPAAPYPMPMYPPQPLFVQHQYPYQPIPYDPQQYYGGGGGGGGSAGGGYGLYGTGGGGSGTGGGGGGGSASNAMAGNHQQQCAPGVQSGGGGGGSQGGGNSAVGAGQGPGGSASPTRQAYTAAAYHQHIAQAYAATTATDAGMYYNMPLYNVALDPATGIYTAESIDVTTGSIAEVNHQKLKYHGSIELNSMSQTDHNIGNKMCTNMFGYKAMHMEPPVMSNMYGSNLVQPYHHVPSNIRHNGHSTTPPDTIHHPDNQSQRSKTPNYLRRNTHPSNKGARPVVQAPRTTSRANSNCEDNYCRTFTKRRRDQRLADQSSASSQRTDSNSSASATVDENLNERKGPIGNDSPPPMPYSPVASLEQSLSVSNHVTADLQVQHHQHSGSYYQPPAANTGGSGGGSGRRNRRNNPRRQAGGGGNVGNSTSQPPAAHEVGAGDAPLPDHSDMCSKMDNLKL